MIGERQPRVDAVVGIVLCNVQTPRMNAIAERWIGGCRLTGRWTPLRR